MRLGGYWLRLATPFALIVAGVVAGAAQRNDPPMLFALAVTAFAATVVTSAVQARRVVALVHEIGSFDEQVTAGEYAARVSARGTAETMRWRQASTPWPPGWPAWAGQGQLHRQGPALAAHAPDCDWYVYTLRRAEDDPVGAGRLDDQRRVRAPRLRSRICSPSGAGRRAARAETFRSRLRRGGRRVRAALRSSATSASILPEQATDRW
jgi:hypothetical protein